MFTYHRELTNKAVGDREKCNPPKKVRVPIAANVQQCQKNLPSKRLFLSCHCNHVMRGF